MIYEFQIVLRELSNALVPQPQGMPFTLLIHGVSAENVKSQMQNSGFFVIGEPIELRPIVDWSKPNFDTDEAGAFLGIRGVSLTNIKCVGKAPCTEFNGRTIYPRKWLEEVLCRKANEFAKQLMPELHAAA